MSEELSQSEAEREDQGKDSSEVEKQFYKSQKGKKISADEGVRLAFKDIVDSAFRRELPLQNETSYFILANVLDFYMTYMLLRNGAIEANPVADFFFKNWGFQGMLYFKLLSVAFICVLAQAIARRSIRHARFVLVVGTCIVGFVVVYSAWLLYNQF